MLSDEKELASHPFIKKVLANLHPLLEAGSRKLKEVAKQGEVRSKEQTELWEHEWYDYEVFTHLSAILSGVERLEQVQNFIRIFPRPRSYEKEGISQHTWVEYHYSYYVITLVSLFDIALILTNSVFRLGNRERDCKADLIMKNSWVRRTPIKQDLADLDKLIKPHRENRNLYVHRGKMPDIASVMGSVDLDRLQLFSLVQMIAEPIVDREIMDWAYEGHVKKINERLQEERGNIHDILWRLCDDLLLIYDEKSTTLHQKWKNILERKGIKAT